MNMQRKTVYCPVLDRQVNGDECYNITMTSEGMGCKEILPEDLDELTNEMKKICFACEWHW